MKLPQRGKIASCSFHFCLFALTGILIVSAPVADAGLVSNDKFLGNVYGSNNTKFTGYWNQVTPENAGKWKVVEPSRDSYSWEALQSAYDFAQSNGMPFKQHTFVWGSRRQVPDWIEGLSQADQRAEVEEFMQEYCRRFPATKYIDVVNEPLHAKPPYRDALGGDGSTGWDWVITAFQMARQHCPKADLLINDYGIINDANARSDYVQIIKLLNQRGLVDGIGIQSHTFNLVGYSVSTLRSNLDALADTGLPIYVSEWDIEGDDQEQLNEYREKFPIVWEHSGVRGITVWGYVVGSTWRYNTGLMYSDGRERPALQWLVSYLGGGPGSSSGGGDINTIVVRARGTSGQESINLKIGGNTIETWKLSTGMQDYTVTTGAGGRITVEFTNDAGSRDVRVDYIQVNGATLQAEDQSINTGVYRNGSCGEGGNSEWLHCNGEIDFGSL